MLSKEIGSGHEQPQADARSGFRQSKNQEVFLFQADVLKDSKGRSAQKRSLELLPSQQEHGRPWSPSIITAQTAASWLAV